MKERRQGDDGFKNKYIYFFIYNKKLWFEVYSPDPCLCLVSNTGPEITDELVKVLRKRLDETTLDIITIMLGRNCKLTPADVEVNYLMR